MIDEELEFKIEQLELMIKRWKRFYVLYRKILAREDVTAKDERCAPARQAGRVTPGRH